MRSSAAVALRALIMLACVVGIPALAVSKCSWQEIASKFQSVHWRAMLGLEEAESEPPRCYLAMPPRQSAADASQSPAPLAPARSVASTSPECLTSATIDSSRAAVKDPAKVEMDAIQQQLKTAGATYYLLETWGRQNQEFRFYCKVAVNGSSDYVRCFEATTGEPLDAMRNVLHQVQDWRKSAAMLP